MNKEYTNPIPGPAGANDPKLDALLRGARVSPALPPRFQEGVWRRIEEAEAPVRSAAGLAWLDALAALMLRPRLAFAGVAALMLAGILLGAYQGEQVARAGEQAQYLAAVAPNALH